MRDSAAGATTAAPAPWMTRDAISRMGSWARPPARQAAERYRVARYHPLDLRLTDVKLVLDARQRHIHDAEIKHHHEGGDKNESQLPGLVRLSRAADLGGGLAGPVVGERCG